MAPLPPDRPNGFEEPPPEDGGMAVDSGLACEGCEALAEPNGLARAEDAAEAPNGLEARAEDAAEAPNDCFTGARPTPVPNGFFVGTRPLAPSKGLLAGTRLAPNGFEGDARGTLLLNGFAGLLPPLLAKGFAGWRAGVFLTGVS